jgi:hypothetical protein
MKKRPGPHKAWTQTLNLAPYTLKPIRPKP